MIEATRRKFLKLVLTGGVTVMSGAAGPIVHSARAAVRRKARKSAATSATLPADMRKEIANQKQYTARTLKTIREHKLATGSPMAFVFRPLRPERRRGAR